MIAAPRDERLHALEELCKWARVHDEATERRERAVATAAKKRMADVVSVLGFDPLEYDAGRDAASVIISRRSQQMLAALPGTTAEIARAAGVGSQHVSAYLWAYVMRGEITCTKQGQTMVWAVVE